MIATALSLNEDFWEGNYGLKQELNMPSQQLSVS
jgi:hypothetical protein